MMQNNENSMDKFKVTKSRSTSNILKHKIGIALGREKQVRQNSTNKKSMSKCSSYLGKQKSMSLRSLSKLTLNPKEKLQNSMNRKLSFCNDQRTLTKERQQIHKNMNASQSLRSSKTQRYEKYDSDLINNPYNNLIWLDSSNNRKLKIVSKSIMTLGENRSQECIEYCVQNEKQSSILFGVKQSKLAIIEKSNIVLITFDQKSRKQQCFSGQKLKKQFSLSFCGYIFIYQSLSIETQMKEIKEKFDFLLQQIQKLSQDGLKDFVIISKIVKRMFQSKFYTNDKQNSFSLLMKIQKSENKNLQQKQILNSRKKSGTAQQLIAQKLFIEKTTTNIRGNSHIMKIQFNKKKFID